jgi:hypothetical protein
MGWEMPPVLLSSALVAAARAEARLPALALVALGVLLEARLPPIPVGVGLAELAMEAAQRSQTHSPVRALQTTEGAVGPRQRQGQAVQVPKAAFLVEAAAAAAEGQFLGRMVTEPAAKSSSLHTGDGRVQSD